MGSRALWLKGAIFCAVLVAALPASAQLVLNGGDSRVVPDDFSGVDPGHDRWILRGGSITVNSATYITTSTTDHRIGQLNTGSLITVNGGRIVTAGRVTMGSAGSAGSLAEGTLTLNAGTISFAGLDAGRTDALGRGIINVNGSTGIFDINGNMSVRNGSEINYAFDASGITPITVTGNLNIESGAAVNVDGTAYTGAAGNIDLIRFGTTSGGTGTVTINGFDPALYSASTFGVDGDSLFVSLTEFVAPVDPDPDDTDTPTTTDPTVVTVNFDTINDLNSSAIPTAMAIGHVGNNTHRLAGRTLNRRIARLRSAYTSESQRPFRMRREVPASRYADSGTMRVEHSISLDPSAGGAASHAASESHGGAAFWPLSTTQAAAASSDPSVIAAGEKWEVFASADFGQYDLDQLGVMPGVDSSTHAATGGIEYRINRNVTIGAGLAHVWNENQLANNFGSIDIEGHTAMTYASFFQNNFWGDAFYSYGDYDVDTSRNTNFGTTARGATKLRANEVALNLGYNIPVEDRFVHGPVFQVSYSQGQIGDYTETGAALANAVIDDQDIESLTTSLVWQLNWRHETDWGCLSPTFRVGYGRENLDQERNVSGSLQTSPVTITQGSLVTPGAGYSNTLATGAAGTDWMEFGAGIGMDFSNGLGVFFDYQGRYFQSDAQLHVGTVKASWEF